MTAGVYTITCLPTGRVYCGSSQDIETRRTSHISLLRTGKHRSKLMIEDYRKYGESAFILQCVHKSMKWDRRLWLEGRLIKKLMKTGNCYNRVITGMVHAPLRKKPATVQPDMIATQKKSSTPASMTREQGIGILRGLYGPEWEKPFYEASGYCSTAIWEFANGITGMTPRMQLEIDKVHREHFASKLDISYPTISRIVSNKKATESRLVELKVEQLKATIQASD